MNCTKCGATIPSDSDFCPECGATVGSGASTGDSMKDSVDTLGAEDSVVPANALDEIQQNQSHQELSAKPEVTQSTSEAKKAEAVDKAHGDTARFVGIFAGILFFVAGLVVIMTASPGCEVTSFGGDAYTYIYQGIVAVANTVALMARAIGGCLSAIGAFTACFFWRKPSLQS